MNEDSSLVERAPSLDRDERRAYRVETDGSDLTVAIVEGIAAVADCDPVADGFRLYDVVDPEALERLVGGHGAGHFDGEVVFEVRGCRIEARSDGALVVHEPTDGQDGSHAPSVGSA